MWSFFYIM